LVCIIANLLNNNQNKKLILLIGIISTKPMPAIFSGIEDGGAYYFLHSKPRISLTDLRLHNEFPELIAATQPEVPLIFPQ